MAEQNGNGADTPQAGPKFSVLAQYTKDLSFENPERAAHLGPAANGSQHLDPDQCERAAARSDGL